jgi:ATP-dependent exoDNAse (exonuclease V) beta subunit
VFASAFDPTLMTPVYTAVKWEGAEKKERRKKEAGKQGQSAEMVNPSVLRPLAYQHYETRFEETQALQQDVQAACQQQPQASKAILVRSNKQAERVCQLLQQAGLPAITFGERHADHQHVFNALYALLQVVAEPRRVAFRVALWRALPATVYGHWLDEAENPEAWKDGETVIASMPLFALAPNDVPPHRVLQQLYYDVHDAQRYTLANQLPTLLIRVGYQWFTSPLERSQVYACALQAQQALHQLSQELDTQLTLKPSLPLGGGLATLSPLEVVLQRFAHVAMGRIRLPQFNEEALQSPTVAPVVVDSVEASTEAVQAPIQIMTLHKSKGQEFDLVWLPYLTQAHFPDALESVKLDDADRLKLVLQQWHQRGYALPVPPLEPQQLDALKQARIAEEARLLYVGITRAKRGLVCSSHTLECDTPSDEGTAQKRFKKTTPTTWARVIEYVMGQQKE